MGMRRYQQALAAQFQGMGCEETLGCCSKGPKIHEWVEHRTFGGYFPEPLLPLPYCRDFQGDRAQLCSMCEGAVQIELESLKDHCDYFQEWVDPLGKPKVRTPILQVFARSLVPGPQQIPMHKSFKERCVKMAAAAEGSFGAMKAAFMKKACKCLGCCEPAEGELACPFPAVYSTFEQAVHEYEKSRP
jgi:transcription elongation factor Elf1